MESWLQVIVALGGFKLIEFAYNVAFNRHTDRRKNEAAADSVVVANMQITIKTLSDQLEIANRRNEERDKKVDYLFEKLESERREKMEANNRAYEMEMKYLESRCIVDDCAKRKPPKIREKAKNENKIPENV